MNLKLLKRVDWFLVLPAFFLTIIGLISIYSSSLSSHNFLAFKKQIIFFLVSFSLAIIISFFELNILKTNSFFVFILYFSSLILLSGLYFLAPRIRGIKGWYKIGSYSFDPVPISALILIILLSKYFSLKHVEIRRFIPIIVSGLYAFLPFVLVLGQPDLGSALSFVFIWLGIIIFSGVRLKHFLAILLIFLIVFASGWVFWLKDYQKQRIISFINPQIDKQGISWNVDQSKIAIGSGGLWGQGIGKGSQVQYGFLPAARTDFIFSAIAQEMGFVGVSILFILFLFLFWRMMKITFLAYDNFTRLFASGFAFLLLSQIFINIGMCLGLAPVIGIPLPFVSYGGSQIFGFYLGLGILSSLSARIRNG